MSETETTTAPSPTGDTVARAGTYYRVTRYIIAIVMVGYGIWSFRDGFIKYPQVNKEIEEWVAKRDKAATEKNEAAFKEASAKVVELGQPKGKLSYILPNQIFGIVLPPLGIAMLLWSLYNSRGEFRLTPQGVLHAPGHPPVPLDNLSELDREVWDKKGIAWIKYQLPDGKTGEIRLDDFIYERKPIDLIYDEVLKKFPSEEEAKDQSPKDSAAAE